MPSSRSLLPSVILLLILIASISTTIVILSSSIRALRTDTQTNLTQLHKHLSTLQKSQDSYNKQIQALTALVVASLNATDEYINNITASVTEAKETIHQDVQQVNELADSQNSLLAVQFAGMFTVLVILVSGYHLSQHVRHLHSPVVQRKIMAVLWMTPIYSVTSWLSLLFPLSEAYLSVVREFYESYCVYTFLSFLISVLGRGDRYAVVGLLERGADELSEPDKCGLPRWCFGCCEWKSHVPLAPGSPERGRGENRTVDTSVPSTVSSTEHALEQAIRQQRNRHKAEAVLDQCQTYAMQFVLLRPITAIGWLVSNQLVQPESFLDWRCPQMYIVIVTNVSIFFAFRGLVKFYHATLVHLAWCNPWPKFLCIKGVVFMTFWQKMTLSIIIHVAYIDNFSSHEEATDFISRSQNFLICLEMLFAAVAHCFVFPPEEWAEGYREREERRRKRQSEFETHFGDSVALGDFIKDVRTVMASKKRRRLRKRKNAKSSKAAGLEMNENVIEEEEYEGDGTNECVLGPTISTESQGAGNGALGNRNRFDSTESFDDEFDPQFSIDDEYDVELTAVDLTSQASFEAAGKSLKAAHSSCSSMGSTGRDYEGSWARIERYINVHGSESNAENKQTASNEKDLSSKELI